MRLRNVQKRLQEYKKKQRKREKAAGLEEGEIPFVADFYRQELFPWPESAEAVYDLATTIASRRQPFDIGLVADWSFLLTHCTTSNQLC